MDIGEQDVEAAVAHEAQKLVAVAVDAEGVGEGERDLVAGLVRDLHGLAESFLRRRRIPEIAFEIDDARGAHRLRVDVVGREVLAGAEIGVHGALAVRRHQDEAAGGGGAVLGERHVVMHVDGLQVVGEELAGLVVLHLADEAGLDAEGGDARRRVGARAARDDHRRAHIAVELLGPRLVDELHGALVHLLLQQEGLVRMGEHVNDGVAEGKNVDAGLGHEPPGL